MSGAAEERLAAIVLAGGAGTRVGGADKGLLVVRGKRLIEHALDALSEAKIAAVVISANRNPDRYARYGFPVVPDEPGPREGPLAGIVAAMSTIDADLVFTMPVDVPDMPRELPRTLATALREDRDASIDVAVAHDGEFRQPLFAVYRTAVLPIARQALQAGRRSVRDWQDTLRCVEVRVGSPADYRNLNTSEQYA